MQRITVEAGRNISKYEQWRNPLNKRELLSSAQQPRLPDRTTASLPDQLKTAIPLTFPSSRSAEQPGKRTIVAGGFRSGEWESGSKAARLALRQAQLDEALGQTYSSEDRLYRSFDVAKDITSLEMAKDRDAYLQELRMMRLNLKTNLVERVKSNTVPITYEIRDGQLFAELPAENPGEKPSAVSVRTIIQEGIDYRLSHGTLEAEREHAELVGWIKLEAALADPQTEIGTTYTVFSPPSSVIEEGKKGAYEKAFINTYTLKSKDGKKYVELTQRDVDLDKEGYRKAAQLLDPQLFVPYDQAAEKPLLDAYLLSRPLKGELPAAILEGKRMEIHDFEKHIYHDPLLKQMVDFYMQGVEDAVLKLPATPNWKELCIRFNAILNMSDQLEKGEQKDFFEPGKTYQIFPEADTNLITELQVMAAVHQIGKLTPVKKGGAGCPTNRGYDVSGGNPSSPLIPEGSVGLAGLASMLKKKDSSEEYSFDHEGTCVVCNSGPTAVGPCEICVPCDAKMGGQAAKKGYALAA
ncbi:MAG: hypothetical protein AAB553_04440 [Patescibacteria group bacterium]